ncbi:MAG TPA: response regulator [Flavisolibacter sp.]|nr:response regulator [Flavisolibacter sp.]
MQLKKILLAEDDSDDQKLFLDFLQNRKDLLILPIVENGARLLEVMQSMNVDELPDLIILDQNMPQKNGLQTLDDLKSDAHFNSIPVVIYSTYADAILTKRAIEKGALMVAMKPLNEQGYHEMMDSFLELCRK